MESRPLPVKSRMGAADGSYLSSFSRLTFGTSSWPDALFSADEAFRIRSNAWPRACSSRLRKRYTFSRCSRLNSVDDVIGITGIHGKLTSFAEATRAEPASTPI